MNWVDKPQNYKNLYGILQLLRGSHLNNFLLKTLKLGWEAFYSVTFQLKCLDFQSNQYKNSSQSSHVSTIGFNTYIYSLHPFTRIEEEDHRLCHVEASSPKKKKTNNCNCNVVINSYLLPPNMALILFFDFCYNCNCNVVINSHLLPPNMALMLFFLLLLLLSL